MLTLYQFPISHYCEKARWALDYKNLDYRKVNLLPGPHMKKTKKLSGKTQVPVLQENGQVIAGSARIIDYLDQEFAGNPLTPADPALKQQAVDWERFADAKIGSQVRLLVYHIILDYPDIVLPMMSQDGPWYAPVYMKLAYPKLAPKMRQYMKINEQTAASSFNELSATVDSLSQHYAEHEFMLGEQFSRADLTAAALLAPIVMPEGYGLDWPQALPDRLAEFNAQFEGRLDWVNRLYRGYR